MTVGKIIRTARKKKGYTLKQLSDKSGVSLTFISDIENGRRTPSPEKAKLLAEALDIDVTPLLDEKVAEMIKEVKKDAEAISNPDIRAIARAGKNLTPEEAEDLRKLAERLFPHAFKKK